MSTRIRRGVAAALLLVAAVSTCVWTQATAAEPAARKAIARTFPLNRYNPYLDGQWQGIGVASDGNVYFGSSSHAHARAGSFFRYGPRTAELTVLSNDLSALCGEDATKQVPQGKTHSEIVELDGWVYFATHLATYWPEHRDRYTGSHIIGYELATGRFRDLGIVRPNYTTYSALAADPARRKLYCVQVPFSDAEQKAGGLHLYEVDVKTAEKKDLGLLKAGGGACFYMFVNSRGECWFNVAYDNGSLHRYTPATGKVERFDNVLPLLRSATNANEIAQPVGENRDRGKQSSRFINWLKPLPDGNCAAFMMGSETVRVPGTFLWLFDSTRPLDRAFAAVKHLGYTDGAKVVAGDRAFFLQREGKQRGGPPKDKQDFHLLSVPINRAAGLGSDAPGPYVPPQTTDHGLLEDQDGRRPWRICSMMSDGKRLYMTGDWYVLEGEKGSKSIEGLREAPKDGNFVYQDRDRGQFFAVVEAVGK